MTLKFSRFRYVFSLYRQIIHNRNLLKFFRIFTPDSSFNLLSNFIHPAYYALFFIIQQKYGPILLQFLTKEFSVDIQRAKLPVRKTFRALSGT